MANTWGSQCGVADFQNARRDASRRAIERAVNEGRWTRVYEGIYAMGPSPLELAPPVRATLLWSRGRLAASHSLAASLHGLDGAAPPALEFSVPRGSWYRSAPGLILHRVADLTDEDVCLKRGFRTTTLVRTVLDLAECEDRRSVVMAYEDLYRRGWWYRNRLLERMKSLRRGFAGLELLREVAHRRGASPPSTESAAEAICDDILWRHGIRLERQQKLFDASGEFVARLDFADPSIKYAIEVDGYATHKGRHAFYRDKRRVQEIQRCGWEVTPVVWDDLNDERRLVRLIGDVLDHRRRLFRSTVPFGPAPREQLELPF